MKCKREKYREKKRTFSGSTDTLKEKDSGLGGGKKEQIGRLVRQILRKGGAKQVNREIEN